MMIRAFYNHVLVLEGLFILMGNGALGALVDPRKFTEKIKSIEKQGMNSHAFQEYVNEIEFLEESIEAENILDKLVSHVESKFSEQVRAIQRIKDAVENSRFVKASDSEFPICCDRSFTLKNDSRFKQGVNDTLFCNHGAGLENPSTGYPTSALNEAFKTNYEENPNLLWQYYGSEEGLLANYPAVYQCDDYDPRFRPFYVITATPKSKDVVVVVDCSVSMNTENGAGKTLLSIAKDAAKTVLRTLSPNDRVGIVTFSNESSTPPGNPETSDCYKDHLAQATSQNIRYLTDDYLANVYHENGYHTNYTAAFSAAFYMFNNTPDPQSGEPRERDQIILFLTDGSPSEDETKILDTITYKLMEADKYEVTILTFRLGSVTDGQEEETILKGIANLTTHGQFTNVRNPDDLRSEMASYYNFLNRNYEVMNGDVSITVPYQDAFNTGLLNAICLPVIINGALKGVACVDIYISDLFSDISYSGTKQRTYSFVVDGTGRTLAHPLLPMPEHREDDPIFVHLTSLERQRQVVSVLQSMIKGDSGSTSFTSSRVVPRGVVQEEGAVATLWHPTYTWKNISGANFSLCIVEANHEVQLTPMPRTINYFNYHKDDLKKHCAYFNQRSTSNASSIQFTAAAFQDPYTYLHTEETTDNIRLYESIMTRKQIHDSDPDRINDTFKKGVNDTVAITQKLDEIWLANRNEWEQNGTYFVKYIYYGSEDGVFRNFPGLQGPKKYDHTLRPWYRRSVGQKDLFTISTPYEDAFGSGYLTAISKAITVSSNVIGVIAMDLSPSYLYTVLTSQVPQCQSTYECFLMDNSGFIVAHEDFNADKIDLKNLHVASKEPYIAKQIWYLMVPNGGNKACIDFGNLKEYHFNDVKLPHKGPIESTDFEMHQIKDTNLFLIVKKNTQKAEADTCFCPTAVDGEIGPCSSSSAMQCRCPCYTNVIYEYCTDKFTLGNDAWPTCPPQAPDLDYSDVSIESKEAIDLPRCYTYDCSKFDTQSVCASFGECLWQDGKCKLAFGPAGSGSYTVIAVGIVIPFLILVAILVLLYRFVIQKRVNKDDNVSNPHSRLSAESLASQDLPSMPGSQTASYVETHNTCAMCAHMYHYFHFYGGSMALNIGPSRLSAPNPDSCPVRTASTSLQESIQLSCASSNYENHCNCNAQKQTDLVYQYPKQYNDTQNINPEHEWVRHMNHLLLRDTLRHRGPFVSPSVLV